MPKKNNETPMVKVENAEVKKEQGLYAWTAKVGSKGQIVIPKEARDIFRIDTGDTLLLLGDKAHGIAIISGDNMKEILLKIKGEIL